MFRRLLDAVREETSGERAHAWVKAIARHHRVQASPGYDEAAEGLRTTLLSLGLDPEWETVPGDGQTRAWQHLLPEGWECTSATALLHDGTGAESLCDFASQPLSLIQRSDSARGRHPLIALADGTEDAHYEGVDVRGRVVLTSGAVQRVHQLAVLERGAAGILADGRRLFPPVRTADTDPDAVNYTSFWWSESQPRGWGFVVSPRTGRRLRERLAAGTALSLEVSIASRRYSTPIPLLSTRIPGDAPGEVLVMAHLCHPYACANDNASGVAAALETARVLKTLRSRGVFPASGRSVRMLWMPELTGTYAWLAAHPPRTRGLVAALNLDMVGEDQDQCGSTQLLEHPPCFAASFAEELLAAIRPEAADRTMSSANGPPVSGIRMAEVPFSGGSDHVPLVDPAVGVPCPMLIQWPDRYYHSSSDTPDRTDPRSLAHAARCAATYAAVIAGAIGEGAEELIALTARGARIRLLGALGSAEPQQALARERLRGDRALASLARLGVAESRIEAERRGLAAFADAETGAPGAPPRFEHPLAAEIPRRRVAAPLHYQRFLLPGWSALPRAERETWRRLELDTRDGELLADLGWAACDGRRTLAEIAGLVWLETGQMAIDLLAESFAHAARLGLAEIGVTAASPRGEAS
jgi:hypothetical protein